MPLSEIKGVFYRIGVEWRQDRNKTEGLRTWRIVRQGTCSEDSVARGRVLNSYLLFEVTMLSGFELSTLDKVFNLPRLLSDLSNEDNTTYLQDYEDYRNQSTSVYYINSITIYFIFIKPVRVYRG